MAHVAGLLSGAVAALCEGSLKGANAHPHHYATGTIAEARLGFVCLTLPTYYQYMVVYLHAYKQVNTNALALNFSPSNPKL